MQCVWLNCVGVGVTGLKVTMSGECMIMVAFCWKITGCLEMVLEEQRDERVGIENEDVDMLEACET